MCRSAYESVGDAQIRKKEIWLVHKTFFVVVLWRGRGVKKYFFKSYECCILSNKHLFHVVLYPRLPPMTTDRFSVFYQLKHFDVFSKLQKQIKFEKREKVLQGRRKVSKLSSYITGEKLRRKWDFHTPVGQLFKLRVSSACNYSTFHLKPLAVTLKSIFMMVAKLNHTREMWTV